mmetsp:Transcript_40990/g.76206  ORF Transcript_40990/g.76206 Transcript_40990/m.76206 type:complete len:312 (+) Transcript_40990:63-998(+)
MASSDVELLLEEQGQRPARAFPKRVALALSLVGLAAIGLLAHRSRALKINTAGFVTLDGDCFEYGTFYASPYKMPGSTRTSENGPKQCQQRCAATPACEHFTFWPDGGCLLTSSESRAKAAPPRFQGTISGPASCGAPEAPEASTAGISQPMDISQPASAADFDTGSSGLAPPGETLSSGLVLGAAPPPSGRVMKVSEQASAELPTMAPIELPDVPTVPPVKMLTGVNGTLCAAYPQCVAAGIKEGNCCPTDAHVNLGCCHGIPPTVLEATLPNEMPIGAECSAHRACVTLNLMGDCCPAANGAKLGCCDD